MPQCKTMPSRFHHDIDPMAMSLIPQQILDLLIAQVLLHQASNKWTCSMSKLLGPYHGISSIHASGEIQWRNCSYARVRTGHTQNADLRPNLCSATLWAPCQDNSSSNTCIHSPQYWWHTPAYTHPASRQLPLETWNWTFFSYIIVLSLFIIII